MPAAKVDSEWAQRQPPRFSEHATLLQNDVIATSDVLFQRTCKRNLLTTVSMYLLDAHAGPDLHIGTLART